MESLPTAPRRDRLMIRKFPRPNDIFVPFNPAVDLEIDGRQEAVGFIFKDHFDLFQIGLIIARGGLLADQTDWGLEEFSVQTDGAVFGHPSTGGLTKIVLQIGRGRPKTFQAGGEAVEGRMPRGTAFTLVDNNIHNNEQRTIFHILMF